MGRTARGVRGIRLGAGHEVVSLIIPQENGLVLTASQFGYGKRSRLDEFPRYGRGSQGVIVFDTADGEKVMSVEHISEPEGDDDVPPDASGAPEVPDAPETE